MSNTDYKDDDWEPPSHGDEVFGDSHKEYPRCIISDWVPLDGIRNFALAAYLRKHAKEPEGSYNIQAIISERKSTGGTASILTPFIMPFLFGYDDILAMMQALGKDRKIRHPFDPLHLLLASKIRTESEGTLYYRDAIDRLEEQNLRSVFCGQSWEKAIQMIIDDMDHHDGPDKEFIKEQLIMLGKLPGFRALNGNRPPPSMEL